MRTTIVIPDSLAERVEAWTSGSTLSEFARLAMAEKVERLEREALARALTEGYTAEAATPSLDGEWGTVEVEGWE